MRLLEDWLDWLVEDWLAAVFILILAALSLVVGLSIVVLVVKLAQLT